MLQTPTLYCSFAWSFTPAWVRDYVHPQCNYVLHVLSLPPSTSLSQLWLVNKPQVVQLYQEVYMTYVLFCRVTLELDRKYVPESCTPAAGIVVVGVACVFKGAA